MWMKKKRAMNPAKKNKKGGVQRQLETLSDVVARITMLPSKLLQATRRMNFAVAVVFWIVL